MHHIYRIEDTTAQQSTVPSNSGPSVVSTLVNLLYWLDQYKFTTAWLIDLTQALDSKQEAFL